MSSTSDNLFEIASRRKFRFSTPVGSISTEDLWTIPLETTIANKPSLNDIAGSLDAQLKNERVSFVTKRSQGNDDLKHKFDLVLRIIDIRSAENDAKLRAGSKAAKKQRLMEVLSQKQDEKLLSMSAEEIEAMINELD